MKKLFKFMSVFMLMLSCIGNAFLFQTNKVHASSSQVVNGMENTSVTEVKSPEGKRLGVLRITPQGSISIEYNYGITELMIVVTRCSNPKALDKDNNLISIKNSEGKFIEKYSWKDAVACYSDDFDGETTIIHASGKYNKKAIGKSNVSAEESSTTTVHLNEYGIGVDEIVRVQVVYDFISTAMTRDLTTGYVANTGAYVPVYCNMDSGMNNCLAIANDGRPQASQNILSSERLKYFAQNNGITSYKEYHTDKTWLVYSGDYIEIQEKAYCQGTCKSEKEKGTIANDDDRMAYLQRYNQFSNINNKEDNMVHIKIGNSSYDSAEQDLKDVMTDDVIPVLMILLGIAAGLSISVLGYQIVKSADEPQERQDKIKRLKNILIGIGVAFLLLFAAKPAIKFIERLME